MPYPWPRVLGCEYLPVYGEDCGRLWEGDFKVECENDLPFYFTYQEIKELVCLCLKPRSILIIFIACDLTNLILQGVGGAISSTSLHRDQIQTGINVIIAGLATQVTSLLICICLGVEFAFRVRKCGRHDLAKNTSELRETRVWKAFLFGMSISLQACSFAMPTYSPHHRSCL